MQPISSFVQRLALDRELHGKAHPSHLLDERLQPAQAGLRLERCLGVLAAHEPEHAAQLLQRLPP